MSLARLLWYVSKISPVVLVIGILIGAIYFKRLPTFYRVIILYLIWGLLAEFRFGFKGDAESNLFFVPVYAVVEFIFFSFLYGRFILQKNWVLMIAFAFYLSLLVVDVWLISQTLDPQYYRSYSKAIADFAIVTYCLFFFFLELRGSVIRREYMVFNAGSLLFFSINFLIHISLNFLVNAPLTVTLGFWLVNIISVISYYIFITQRLWVCGRKNSF